MKVNLAHPLISCICITNNRPNMLLKASFNFIYQNYPNRELVLSYPLDDVVTEELIIQITSSTHLPVITIKRDPNESLGRARNQAIEQCNGEYICVWDDDDIYHFDRIMHQFNDMQGKYVEAGVLTRIYMYDSIADKSYFSTANNWAGTLICKKDLILSYPYRDTNYIEDADLMQALETKKLLHKIEDSPYLYIYVRHQDNGLEDFYTDYLLHSSLVLDEKSNNYLKDQFKSKIEIR